MKKLFSIVVVSIAFALSVNAQYYYDRSKNPDRPVQPRGKIRTESTGDYSKFFFLSWDGNSPLSNQAYINQFSATGFKLGFRKRINDEDKLWVGGDFGESVYNQYLPYQTYNTGTGASVGTDLYHYAYNYNLTVNIDYFFFPMEKLFSPYVGLGIGASYIKFAEYYNIYSNSAGSWGFLARPEVGFLVGFKQNSPWRLKAAAHFDYSSNAYTFTYPDFIATSSYQSFINAGFQIGIVKMVR